MAKVEISVPAERLVEEFTALVAQPTTPVTAAPPKIGLVEVSQTLPTNLVPGPPGPPGARGSRWTTGSGAPTVTTGNILGDQYLNSDDGVVWTWDGTQWVMTGTDLTGPVGPAGSPDTGPDILAKLAPVDGAGSGLDADLLDGQTGSYYTTLANQTGTISQAQHGNLPGGALHAAATASTAGFFTDAAADGKQYVRKNSAWQEVVVPPNTVVSDTPPASPALGQLWYESDSGNTYIWYTDADSSQWVKVNVQGGTPTPNLAISNIVTTVVTADGTYTKPANLKFLEVTGFGGGGGGAGAPTTVAGQTSCGAGGNGGAKATILLAASAIGATVAMTIGVGGTAGGGSGSAGTGGDTTFGSFLSAAGGTGGSAAPASATYARASVGPPVQSTTGDVRGWTFSATAAFMDTALGSGVPGISGANELGGSLHASVNATGISGSANTGAGGSGVVHGASQAAHSGGAGGSGVIILKEYF